MVIKSLIVKIEYRMDAGPGARPKWKALRGRVQMPDECCPGRFTYGTDLFTPNVTNIDMAIAKSMLALRHVETITFIFGDGITLENRVYKNGRFLGAKMVS